MNSSHGDEDSAQVDSAGRSPLFALMTSPAPVPFLRVARRAMTIRIHYRRPSKSGFRQYALIRRGFRRRVTLPGEKAEEPRNLRRRGLVRDHETWDTRDGTYTGDSDHGLSTTVMATTVRRFPLGDDHR